MPVNGSSYVANNRVSQPESISSTSRSYSDDSSNSLNNKDFSTVIADQRERSKNAQQSTSGPDRRQPQADQGRPRPQQSANDDGRRLPPADDGLPSAADQERSVDGVATEVTDINENVAVTDPSLELDALGLALLAEADVAGQGVVGQGVAGEGTATGQESTTVIDPEASDNPLLELDTESAESNAGTSAGEVEDAGVQAAIAAAMAATGRVAGTAKSGGIAGTAKGGEPSAARAVSSAAATIAPSLTAAVVTAATPATPAAAADVATIVGQPLTQSPEGAKDFMATLAQSRQVEAGMMVVKSADGEVAQALDLPAGKTSQWNNLAASTPGLGLDGALLGGAGTGTAAGANLTEQLAATTAAVGAGAAGRAEPMQTYRAADPLALPVTVGKPGWNDSVVQKVMWMSSQNIQQAEIALDPPELGPLQVKITTQADQTTVSFTSANGSVREALDQSVGRLREMLENEGLNLTDVDVSDHGAEGRNDANDEEGDIDLAGVQGADGDGATDAENDAPVNIATMSLGLVDQYV